MDRANDKKRKLGRGLGTLMGPITPVRVDTPPSSPASTPTPPAQKAAEVPPTATAQPAPNVPTPSSAPPPMVGDPTGVVFLDLAAIIPNRNQPRSVFEPGSLERLAESIRRSGVMQPVIVRPRRLGPTTPGQPAGPGYELIAGERRWRAAAIAGLRVIPALVRDLDDRESAEWALMENVHREDLNPVERASALRALCERFGLSPPQVAERVGLDRTSVINLLRLLDLEPEILEMLSAGSLTAGHARALLTAPAGAARASLARRVVEEGLSVRQIEAEARSAKAGAAVLGTNSGAASSGGGAAGSNGAAGGGVSPKERARLARLAVLSDLEKQLSEQLGTQVAIRAARGGTRGRLEIAYYSLDHFDALMGRLGVRVD